MKDRLTGTAYAAKIVRRRMTQQERHPKRPGLTHEAAMVHYLQSKIPVADYVDFHSEDNIECLVLKLRGPSLEGRRTNSPLELATLGLEMVGLLT